MHDNIRHVLCSNLPRIPSSASSKFCIHASRHYVTDTNIVVTVVEHHRFTKTVEAKLRRIVGGTPRKSVLSCEAADINHVTTASLAHQRQRLPATIENAAQVCIQCRLPVIESQIRDRSEHSDAGVIDQHVHGTKPLLDSLEELLHAIAITHIDHVAEDLTFSGLGKILYSFVQSFLGARADGQRHPCSCDSMRDRETDTAARTCNDDYLTA